MKPKKKKVVKKKVRIQKIGYGRPRRYYGWRRPIYYNPPPIVTRPVYNIVRKSPPAPSGLDSPLVRSVLGVGLIAAMVTIIIMALKR
tara:strand:- start:231 stop:491 length:261 start_codon:yes stop_codon:yes gene_type:complete